MTDSDESLAESFWTVARELRRRSRFLLEPWDISPSHARALAVLLQDGSLRLSELSDRLHIAPRSATEVVDVLESHGFVERRADPDDRRATLVVLTEDGRQVGGSIALARKIDAARFFDHLSETDRTHLARILRKLSS